MILCHNLEELVFLKDEAEKWLSKMGLALKASKTRITHPLHRHEGRIGFNFLGFEVRQYPVGKYRTRTFRGKPGFKTLIKPSKASQIRHLRQIKKIIRRHRGSNQAALIAELNPLIRGWSAYFSTVVSKKIFSKIENEMFRMVFRWEKWQHPKKSWQWRQQRCWIRENGRKLFSDGKSTLILYRELLNGIRR